jgi:hypothetical protein
VWGAGERGRRPCWTGSGRRLGGCGARGVVGLASTGSRIRLRLAGIAPSRSARRPGGRATSLRVVRRLSETGTTYRRPGSHYLAWRVRPGSSGPGVVPVGDASSSTACAEAKIRERTVSRLVARSPLWGSVGLITVEKGAGELRVQAEYVEVPVKVTSVTWTGDPLPATLWVTVTPSTRGPAATAVTPRSSTSTS